MSVYKISHPNSLNIYIGSTKTTIKKRFYSHKTHALYPDKYKSLLYELMRNENREGFIVELLETCEHDKLREREQFYMNELNPQLNKIKSLRTLDERREYEKLRQQSEKVKKYKREWYLKKKENAIPAM